MPLPVHQWRNAGGNRLIAAQLDYDPEDLAREVEQLETGLNHGQRVAVDRIMHSCDNQLGNTFFLHGPGGTGKTYVYRLLAAKVRAQGNIVLCVASSGIAALLLPGGRTAHSTFKIPIPILEGGICPIAKDSPLAELIRETRLII
ncbi:hypothetical protein BOTBODRAFT_85219, partial [Botryobasidium botryosum FD-172 SS1]